MSWWGYEVMSWWVGEFMSFWFYELISLWALDFVSWWVDIFGSYWVFVSLLLKWCYRFIFPNKSAWVPVFNISRVNSELFCSHINNQLGCMWHSHCPLLLPWSMWGLKQADNLPLLIIRLSPLWACSLASHVSYIAWGLFKLFRSQKSVHHQMPNFVNISSALVYSFTRPCALSSSACS